MNNTIAILCVAVPGVLAIFFQWRFFFKDEIARLRKRVRLLESLVDLSEKTDASRKAHIKALQEHLAIYQMTPRSLKMAVVLMENTPGSLDVAMKSIGITLPGEAAKKREAAS